MKTLVDNDYNMKKIKTHWHINASSIWKYELKNVLKHAIF
jgi:hypothetical protein